MARGRAGPRPPDERRLYRDLAWTWPIISPPEDYPDPRDTWFESTFIFVIRRGGGLRVEVDRHRAGLFPIPTWRRALREAGFRVVRETMRGGPGEPAVPMFVGVREV